MERSKETYMNWVEKEEERTYNWKVQDEVQDYLFSQGNLPRGYEGHYE